MFQSASIRGVMALEKILDVGEESQPSRLPLQL
jgi:hypothetical protein